MVLRGRAPALVIVAAMSLRGVGCGDGASPMALDAGVDIDAPTGPRLDPATIVMAVPVGRRRAVAWPGGVAPFAVTQVAGAAGLEVTIAGVRADVPGVRVLDVELEVVSRDGVRRVRLIAAVDAAVFIGAVSRDVLDSTNWDEASDGAVADQPWAFLAEATRPAEIPAGLEHAHDVLVERGAAVYGDRLVVVAARFVGQGGLAPTSPWLTRAVIECRGGSVEGQVPELSVTTTCAIHADVETSRFTVDGGTLVIDDDARLDSGVGESFVTAGGRLEIGRGTVRNRRELAVSAGGTLHAGPGSHLELARLVLGHGGGAAATLGGDAIVETWLEIDATSTLTTTPTSHTDTGGIELAGVWRHAGVASLGPLRVTATGQFVNTGTASATSCDVAGTLVGPSPCPP